jgi:hypothetical protein
MAPPRKLPTSCAAERENGAAATVATGVAIFSHHEAFVDGFGWDVREPVPV